MKTYTIHADYSPSGSGKVLQYRLTRYGKNYRTARVENKGDDVMLVWQLVRYAETLGATHIKRAWTGNVDPV